MELLEQIAICKKQEETCQFTTFDNDTAWELGCILVNRAKKDSLGILIDISFNGHTLFKYCAKGATGYNDQWVLRKQNTVHLQEMSSLRFGYEMAQAGKMDTLPMYLDPYDYATCGGGFPIIVKGTGVVGCITVSGLKDTEDHQVIVDALMEYFGK
ncbi:heme-degrading domain-containing protein [Chakrabartyella piscis]|uniref:heme-degrading domain-containing protein n=1 Tax=Chakrabartyella piscis TaxID=2918914 RepID=UPI0029586AE5|nr:heme-degrading domain-containing protein [Chakrabartyella piscis]